VELGFVNMELQCLNMHHTEVTINRRIIYVFTKVYTTHNELDY
jgi:hypothetical protein